MEEFLARMSPRERGPAAPPAPAPSWSLSRIDRGGLVYATDAMETPTDVLAEAVFPTSLVDANLVGNIYFANYFTWQSGLLDQLVHRAIPEVLEGTERTGELVCTGTSIDFLREAMPFDDVRVKLRARRVHEGGVDLESSFYRRKAGGPETKIAVAKLGGVWLERRDGELVPARMPEPLLAALSRRGAPAPEEAPPPAPRAPARKEPASLETVEPD
jgi:acyl-CoA thioesterase FadM